MSSLRASLEESRGVAPSGSRETAHPASLRLEGVSKRFGETVALNDARLRIAPGEFVTLLGPSGCGKTTLLNLIAGFIEADSGEIFLDGRPITHVPTWERDIGMVFQNYALFPHMNVARNVAYGLRMRGVSRAEIADRVTAALAMVKLGGMMDRRPRELSGGQQQRVALARALVIDPKVLLLDEPLSALDKNLRAEMQIELRELQQRLGVTTIFVTHDQNEALSLSDRVVVMNDGMIRQIGSPHEVYHRPAERFVASFVGDGSVLRGRIASGDGERLAVEVGEARLTGARSGFPEAVAGQPADIFIRPEALRLALPGEAAIAQGTVGARIFQGSHTDMFIDTPASPSGRVLIRPPASDAASQWQVGDGVRLAIAGEREVSIFPPEPD
jgi:spermidine/putrescine ABC transporter ATP-binding subunit